MSIFKQRIAAEAANHVSIGFLQGVGFALALLAVSFAGAIIVHHPLGLLGGLIGSGFYLWWQRRKKARALGVRQIT